MATNQGEIVQCIGAVVDVQFKRKEMPRVYDALTMDGSELTLEVQQQLGDGVVRTIALGSTDIYSTVDTLRARGIPFQDTPDTYYELVDERVKGHGEPTDELEKRRILVDGAPTEGQGLLLQIFTQNVIGPIFFEIIQRKGNEGFGEGNFKALFESIELDQMRRGVI